MNTSYITLRRIVGLLGIVLPVVLIIEGLLLFHHLQPSISDYYSFRTRDVFVGILVTIGWFFYAYKGYDTTDAILGKISCVAALNVAFFPNAGTPVEHSIHLISALVLFTMLAVYAFRFRKTSGTPTPQKLVRNRVYLASGYTIIGSVLGVVWSATHATIADPLRLMLICETLALWAFGFAWFVKGNTLWKDTV